MKEIIRHKIKHNLKRVETSIKWVLFAIISGVVAGGAGTLFYFGMTLVTLIRTKHPWLIFLLPFGGLVIVGCYRLLHDEQDTGTNLVISAIHSDDNLPLKMAPLIFISTLITHLFGGSAGREGAALQMGGSLGDFLAQTFHFDEKDKKQIIHLKFKGKEEIILNNPVELNNYLSSGTVKGMITFTLAQEVLKSGGYIVVDEVENHFNKEIVTILMRFFIDSKLNKNGGTLIFSTHYPELLDEYDRNDSIFITRNRNGITVENLSNILKRNDIKKSDAYQSGFLEGTTPTYEAYMQLKKSIARGIVMIYTVKRIEEDLDFGCEERPKGMPVMAIVTLMNSSGEEIRIKAEDAMLYECNINEGDKVCFDVNNKLEKVALPN